MTSITAHRAGRATASLLTGLIVAATGLLGTAAPAHAASHAVVIRQYAYSPPSLSVQQGDTVTWTNEDTVAHDVMVTSGPASFHSPMLAKGQSWSFTFATAGSYGYVCSVHPDMTATISVAPRAAAASQTPRPVHSAGPQAHAHTESAAPTAAATSAAPAPRPGRQPASSPAPTAAAVAAPEATQQVSTVAAPTATLDPLLIVAGVSTAVMVFCLLLMTSRPVARPATSGEDPEE